MEKPDLAITLHLRRDLHFTLQESRENIYVMEDRFRRKFFRIGRAEYLFLTQLDGKSSLERIIEQTNKLLGEDLFDERQAVVIIDWLAQNQLLSDGNEEMALGRQASAEKEKKQKLLSRFNLLTIKIPLLNPDNFFQQITPWFGWLTGPLFAFFWLATLIYAYSVLVQHWEQFFRTAASALSLGNLIFLWLAWFFLKILHEISHALVCYRYQGRVDEAGILFILFFPLTYINASTSWGFPSRWQRIHAALAGVYAELFLAAVAVLVWADSPGTVAGIIAHNLIVVAGFSSLLFNGNPLMRFDGYFVLSDSTGIPNLYSRGREFVNSIFSYIFFGKWNYIKRLSGPKELFIGLYGIASWIWRLFILAVLLLLMSTMFHGFGIIIAAASLILLIGLPAWRLIKRLVELFRQKSPECTRFIISSCTLVFGVLFLLNALEWQAQVTVPAVVQYENETVVRSGVSGFISELYVSTGDQVAKGTPLLKLDNNEIQTELKHHQLQLESLRLQKHNTLIHEELTTYQVLERKSEVAKQRIKALEEDIAALTVLAPVDGVVLGRRLDSRMGTYLKEGEEIVSIVSEHNKKLIASVGQNDVEPFRNSKNNETLVTLRSMARTSFLLRITHISPTAETTVPDSSLSAAYGGPLAVRQSQNADSQNFGDGKRGQYRFFTPRFQVEIKLPSDRADSLLVGQLTSVTVTGHSLSYYHLLKTKVSHYFSDKLLRRTDSTMIN